LRFAAPEASVSVWRRGPPRRTAAKAARFRRSLIRVRISRDVCTETSFDAGTWPPYMFPRVHARCREDVRSERALLEAVGAVTAASRESAEAVLRALAAALTALDPAIDVVLAFRREGDELATTAMVREAKEEAGISINPSKLKFVHLAHRLDRDKTGQERLDIFFELREWQGEIKNMESDKCADLSWFPINKLPPDILPFIGLVIKDISSSVMYSEYRAEPSS